MFRCFSPFAHVISKGSEKDADSYSAFYDVYGKPASNIETLLHEENIETDIYAGLCTDYCVGQSALDDAANSNRRVFVISDATTAVLPNGKTNLQTAFKLLNTSKRVIDINNPEEYIQIGKPLYTPEVI